MSYKKKKLSEQRQIHFKLKLNTSDYTKYYKKYMQKQYPMIQILVKKIVQMPFCRQYYLKYPLDGLLRGVCKKMLINVYQLIVLGYFLSQVNWKLDHYIYSALSDIFPNVIHVNQPTDPDKLKQLSMFLYFSSYNMTIYRQQMIKIFPEFQHIQNNWTSSQHTVGQILNPRLLNKFYQQAARLENIVDYNFCVDKILQISPCYDITSKTEKSKEFINFGFMEMKQNNQQINNFNNHMNPVNMYFHHNQNHHQMKIQDINMDDFKQFDGDI